MPNTSDLTPPKAAPLRHFNWGWGSSDASSQIESGQDNPGLHPPLSGNGAENEAGKGPLLKAAEGVKPLADQVSEGIKSALSIFIPSPGQKRDIAVYGLALIVFVVAIVAVLR